jgi:hypothetical protein
LRRDPALGAGLARAGFFFDPVRCEVDLAMEPRFEVRPAPNDHGGGCRCKRADGMTPAIDVIS